jgi:hypothetical protein
MSVSPHHDAPALLDGRFPVPVDRPFTYQQARQAGISRNALARLVEEGLLRRLIRNVYAAAQLRDSLALRAEALALVVPDDAVVTDRTAGWLHGADVLAPGDHERVPPVSVFRRHSGTRLRNDLVLSGERTLRRDDVVELHGLRVTSPLRTAWDLGRLLHRDSAIGALDALLRVGGFERAALLAGVERFAKQRGVRQLRELVPLADGRAQSPGESTLRLRWLDQTSLPRPTPQIPVLDDLGRAACYLDLGVEALKFAVEYDGEKFHSTDADVAHDRERRAWLERRGWTILVVRRDNVYGPRRDGEELLHEGILAARARAAGG